MGTLPGLDDWGRHADTSAVISQTVRTAQRQLNSTAPAPTLLRSSFPSAIKRSSCALSALFSWLSEAASPAHKMHTNRNRDSPNQHKQQQQCQHQQRHVHNWWRHVEFCSPCKKLCGAGVLAAAGV
jgi:hypothetical protein